MISGPSKLACEGATRIMNEVHDIMISGPSKLACDQEDFMKRKSNFELFRIVAMCMIICSHYCVHNGVEVSMPPYGWAKIFFSWGIMGNLGVDIFFILSGYFLWTKEKPFSREKAIKLLREVFFYSIVIYGALVVSGAEVFSVKNLIFSLFPTLLMQYSFFTVYIVIYMLSPWLVTTRNRGGVELKSILLVLFIVFSVIPTILPIAFIDSYFTDGILLFFVGGFLREYRANIWNKFSSLALAGTAVVLWLGTGMFTVVLSEKISLYSYYFLYERNSPVTILVAVLLFVAFGQWEMKSYTLVNIMAKHVFAVFLIHDNLFFSPVMWHTWFDNTKFRDGYLLGFHMLFAVSVIFVICVLTDMVREYIMEDILIGKCCRAFRRRKERK